MTFRRNLITFIVVAQAAIVAGCADPGEPRVGVVRSAQFPIDAKVAAWIELRAVDASGQLMGHIGYMLAVGVDVSSQTLETSKGDIDVTEPALELWFSATQDATEATSNGQVAFDIKEQYDVEESGWTRIRDAVNSSRGLSDQSGKLPPDFVGESGAVSWSNDTFDLDNIGAGPTYGWSDNGVDWGLTIVQDETLLTTLYWSHDSAMSNGTIPVPQGQLAYEASPEPTRIYVGYEAP